MTIQATTRTTLLNRALVLAIGGTLLATLGMSVPSAHAVDGKRYAGSSCVRWSGSTSIGYNYSAIGNTSSTNGNYLYLDCPAVQDAGGIQSSWVRVKDRHYSRDIRCSVVSTYMNNSGGFSGSFGSQVYSSGSNSAPQVLQTGSASGYSSGHYYFSCRIPERYNGETSYIATYHVTEN